MIDSIISKRVEGHASNERWAIFSHMSRLLKAAILCGAVPLFVGTLIYAGWRLTRWDWLMDAGCYTIYVGALVFVVGAVCLLRYLWRKKGVDPARSEEHTSELQS